MTFFETNSVRKFLFFYAALMTSSAQIHASEQGPGVCIDLLNIELNRANVTVAEIVEAGAFAQPSQSNTPVTTQSGSANQTSNRVFQELPEFCRVAVNMTPSDDSDINMEIWLPSGNWNGKFLAVGNGAFTGNIRYPALIAPLSRGYATSSTDTGHLGNTASFGLGHPEKVIDFGWRAVHEMTVVSKQLIEAYYQRRPEYSYWSGCSAGGRQAMKEAQRFPGDFDGIIAGAPGLDWTGRAAASLKVASFLETRQSFQLSAQKRELVYQAAINACDAVDDLVDGLISTPAQCDFDPVVLQCQGQESSSCLSPEQVTTVRMMYESPINPSTGREISGLLPGSEMGWTDLGWTRSARATGLEQYRYLVYQDPSWTIDRFEFEVDIVKAEQQDNNTLNAMDTNLKPFFDNGGKLIQYHGWADPQISPDNATQYYDSVASQLGGRELIHDSMRLFMVPGMAHCGGGPGPNNFDMVSALEEWVEQGIAPDRIVAVHITDGEVDRSRPLCPYPEVTVYDGDGSIDLAENFECRLPD